MNGLHYSDAADGRVFSQSCTPLGLAIPIYTATAIAGSMPIWNPPDSGVNVEVVAVTVVRASGTAVFGAISFLARPLLAIATGALCTAFADTTPKNGLIGGGRTSKVKSSNAGTVTVTAGAAGDNYRTLYSLGVEADATTAGINQGTEWLNGTMIVPPGWLVYLVGTQATGALMATSIVWKEIDR